jgi:cytochrome c oxidase subunit II
VKSRLEPQRSAMTRALPGRGAAFVALAMTLLLAGCGTTESPNILDPRGPAAAQIANLWWLMFWMGLAVLIIVLALLTIATIQARRRPRDERPPVSGQSMVIWGGVIFPLPILLIVLGYTIYSGNVTTHAPPSVGGAPENPVIVDVIGHQFWWEVRYLNRGVLTANEIHIPVGQPVLFRVTSADVIHSFWVPQLHGKIDLMPGDTNQIWLQADEPGLFRGICAEFCGLQHAHMQFLVIAQPPDEFEVWAAQQAQPAVEPTDPLLIQGQQVYLGAGCVYCHTIGGVNPPSATESVGPDLTHLASRRTLGAAMLENQPGHLAGWVLDPQAIKPGNKMPPTRMNSQDLQALLAYLQSLR